MDELKIVLDTDVFYTALRSQRGSAYQLLQKIGVNSSFRIYLSVPLLLEYEDIAKRHARSLGLTHDDIDDILDYLCSVAGLQTVFFLWRPFLKDPDDDMLLELAVEAGCRRIVTYNTSDFRRIEQFGIRAVTSREFLREIEVNS